jgi:hypothetical protein
MESAMVDKWVLTWARIAFVPFGRKNGPPFREQKAFDCESDAIDFAMSLDVPQRRTAQLHLPCGDIAELTEIEQMHAAQK